MSKAGMRRNVYFHSDPTFDAVWAKWRKEEREAKKEERSMIPLRVMGIIRLFVKRAGYQLLSDIEIMDVKSGDKFRSVTRGRNGK